MMTKEASASKPYRILVADESNFVAAKRQRFLARAATEPSVESQLPL